MLDGPYNNKVWNGQEIAVIDIPADAPRTAKTYQVAVPAVEGLTGKHAVYLVAEGPEVKQPERPQWMRQMPQRPEGLFDLHGIGFAKNGTTCERPAVPEVTITADGQKLNIPAIPVRTTNANGYTDITRYQVYGKLCDNTVLQATASDPAVKLEVGKITEGRATIKATHKGVTKIFLIN